MNLSPHLRETLPSAMVTDLAALPAIRYKYHPHIEQAIFRSIQETIDNFPEDVNLANEKFGKLSVNSYAGLVNHVDGKTGVKEWFDQWWVSCDCGKPEKKVGGNHLRTGNTRSCGCARGRHGKRTEEYFNSFPQRFESWKHPKRFEAVNGE